MVEDKGAARRGARRRPDLDTVYTINADGSRNVLHPADVKGRWQRRKHAVFAVLIAVFLLLPWLRVGGRPAVHLDLPARAAHLFGATFTNQDFYLVFFVATGLGFALFVLTSLWGRVWCGYLCPQTVFLEGVFRRLERLVEGSRSQRIRRDLAPWTAGKLARKLLKHALFAALAALAAHAFIAYFIPARELARALLGDPFAHRTAFLWGLSWTGLLYFDYAWFREQTCLIICPYGRLQSTLIDRDTVIIGYDARRGEPRGKGEGAGDCVDCFRCVEVCPTGIDIRNGLQMECVGCANCVDACDEIMARLGRPPGLVRYDSQRGLETGRRRFLRARVWVYAALAAVGLIAFGFKAAGRGDFEARALRPAGLPFAIEAGRIRNVYTLHVQNKSDEPRVYRIAPAARERVEWIVPQPRLALAGLADERVPLLASLAREDWSAPFDLRVAVTDSATGDSREVALRFRGP